MLLPPSADATMRCRTSSAPTDSSVASERRSRGHSEGSSSSKGANVREQLQIWRPVVGLILVALVMKCVMFVEDNPKLAPTGFGILKAADGKSDKATQTWLQKLAGCETVKGSPPSILDTGFVVTRPLYKFLCDNPWWNDFIAFMNSLLVLYATWIVIKATLWIGDYGLLFKFLFTQCLRAVSGWFTYLPPSDEYISSPFDVPDIFSSGVISLDGFVFGHPQPESSNMIPFVSFFSGHVANVVCVANYLYLSKHASAPKTAVLLHFLNVLQIVRLVATRGHYSIDILVGWIVAVYVSAPAERLGNWYSRTSVKEICEIYADPSQSGLPRSAVEVFEWAIRAKDHRKRIASWCKSEEPLPKAPLRIAAEGASAKLEGAGVHLSQASTAALEELKTTADAAATALEAKVVAVESALHIAAENANSALEGTRHAFEEAKNAALDGVKERADAATGAFEKAKQLAVTALEELSMAVKSSTDAAEAARASAALVATQQGHLGEELEQH